MGVSRMCGKVGLLPADENTITAANVKSVLGKSCFLKKRNIVFI